MFQTARLKLTAWYLLIIMTICILFSLMVFNRVHRDLVLIEFNPARMERFERRVLPPPGTIIDIRHRLLMTLVLINSSILVISGVLGYWLAGKTLEPIQAMVEEQNRFISDASHELKTPLTSLKTAFEVYLRRKKSRLAEESLVEVNKLQSLTESLLQLTSNRPIIFKSVALKNVLAEALRQIKPLAKAKQISIKVPRTDLKIKGNEEQLSELFVILLDNSIKYSQSKTEVKISAVKTDGKVIIEVSDQGIGINGRDLPRIFDRFYRADSARTKLGAGGYGLGLAIAKKIVEGHHGSIKVISNLQQGTTFQLTFSLAG